jgi:hypothetical protein
MSNVSNPASTLRKHIRYGDSYVPGEIYWGLGIECETYIELKGGLDCKAEFLRNHQKRERYSVDYWKTYKPGVIDNVLEKWIKTLPETSNTILNYPLLINAHSFCKTDRYGQSVTTYSKVPVLNSKYCGTTLLQDLSGVSQDVFGSNGGQDQWWTFDGDTVEFMTQHYYCVKMEDVVDELLHYKKTWLDALQSGLMKIPGKDDIYNQPVSYPTKNYGLALYTTNMNNIGIFNNGTYHFNITLPTYLDKDCIIADKDEFKIRHQRLARLFQWFTPFLIARYGSGDIFSTLTSSSSSQFPRGSQRLCVSRFVGAGTYDTETMESGKLLTIPNKRIEGRWYEQIYDNPDCAYIPLPQLGLDINYNKHWNHGLEFRIFDWFPETELPNLFRCLIWMCDESLMVESIPNPHNSDVWNSVLAKVIWNGSSVVLNSKEAADFSNIFRIPTSAMENCDMRTAFERIWNCWGLRWNFTSDTNTCTFKMIRTPLEKNQFVEHKSDASVPDPISVPAPPLPTPTPVPTEPTVEPETVPVVPIVTPVGSNIWSNIISCLRCR